MAITVKAVCYKSKVLSNNESPLMLRVTKDRKLKYVSLGISLNPAHWDFSKNEPKTDCPNREYIEMLIAILVVVFIVFLCISPLYTIGIFWILATIYSMLIH